VTSTRNEHDHDEVSRLLFRLARDSLTLALSQRERVGVRVTREAARRPLDRRKKFD
jgi:hypothetical protein